MCIRDSNTGGAPANTAIPVLDILTGLLSGSAVGAAIHEGVTPGLLNGRPDITGAINGLLGNETIDNNANTNVPKAYINYMFFDGEFKYAGGGFSKVGGN